MAAITGFTYAILKQRKIDASVSEKQMKLRLTAGDGSLTYPTGGIPVDKTLLGLPNIVESLIQSDSYAPDGYVYKYNQTSGKIMMFRQTAATSALVEVANTVAPTIDINVIAEGY